MGYKKDIFGIFAYEFELSQYNEILADARMKSANADEIFGFALDEIKSASPIPAKRDFIALRFHPPKVDLFRHRRI